jgi:hypothetical protein
VDTVTLIEIIAGLIKSIINIAREQGLTPEQIEKAILLSRAESLRIIECEKKNEEEVKTILSSIASENVNSSNR